MAKEPRAPAVMPGQPIPTYPTPLIEDSIEVEVVDVVGGVYSLLPYGTPYNEVGHGAFAQDLPGHVLCADEVADAGGARRKRTWAKPRDAQDRYNFAISYDGNDTEYPVYTRTYVFIREGYTPLELLCPDPFDPNAFLIAEQTAQELDPVQLKSVFIKVTRIFSTLPGPILYSIEYPYGGHPSYPRITTKQKFAHQKFADNLGTKCGIENYLGAVLVAQSIQQTEYAGVDSVQRIYDVVPQVTYAGGTLPDGTVTPNDDFGGQEKFGFSVGYMYGRKDYPFLTWNFTLPIAGYEPAFDLSPCPIAGYEALQLVTQETKGDDKQALLMVVSRRYETLPGPVIHKVDFDNNNPDYPIVSTSQRVAVNAYAPSGITAVTCPVPGYTNLVLYEQHLAPTDYGSVKEDQRIYELNPSDKVITLDYDSAVDGFVQTIKQKVPAGTIPVLDDLSLEYREKAVDKFRTIQVQSRLTSLPPDRVEFKTVNNWSFPTLLTGIALSKGALVTNRYEVVWFPNTLRPIQNVPAILRITTSYHTAPPPPETIFVLPTRNLVYQGISFQFSISNVLCDNINLSVSFTSDTKYGNLTESVSFAATNPSASAYYDVIGQYKVVGCDISIWRARVYVKTVTEVVLI